MALAKKNQIFSKIKLYEKNLLFICLGFHYSF